jgi:prepilin-type N-terminal cleavage/methylation domain-containing protein
MPNLQRRRRGFSLIELLIVISIILIIMFVALPKLQNVLRSARETAALKAIQTIHQVETQYYSQYGRYAVSLTELGPPTSGGASPAAADLIDSTLAQGIKGGYKFTVTANEGGYAVNANPVTFNVDGSRTFYSDHTMVLRQNFGPEPATANSPEIRQ